MDNIKKSLKGYEIEMFICSIILVLLVYNIVVDKSNILDIITISSIGFMALLYSKDREKSLIALLIVMLAYKIMGANLHIVELTASIICIVGLYIKIKIGDRYKGNKDFVIMGKIVKVHIVACLICMIAVVVFFSYQGILIANKMEFTQISRGWVYLYAICNIYRQADIMIISISLACNDKLALIMTSFSVVSYNVIMYTEGLKTNTINYDIISLCGISIIALIICFVRLNREGRKEKIECTTVVD